MSGGDDLPLRQSEAQSPDTFSFQWRLSPCELEWEERRMGGQIFLAGEKHLEALPQRANVFIALMFIPLSVS